MDYPTLPVSILSYKYQNQTRKTKIHQSKAQPCNLDKSYQDSCTSPQTEHLCSITFITCKGSRMRPCKVKLAMIPKASFKNPLTIEEWFKRVS